MTESVLVVDAVITWVDVNDSDHRKKWKKYKKRNQNTVNELSTGRDKTRFVNNGELEYCLHSIRKFAPWIRKIFLITDNQTPEFIDDNFKAENNITIVDHKTIFESFEWALPTFNSRTLESMLWRIPEIANHFIYFNDDFVLTEPVKPKDFFQDGNVVLRGGWKAIRNYGAIRLKVNEWVSNIAKNLFGITRSMNLLLQINSARIAGFNDKYFRIPHVPHPIRKKTISDFFEVNPLLLSENIKYKFRNLDQFSAIYLANHLEIINERVDFCEKDDFLMLNGELDIKMTFEKKLNKIKNQGVRFLCIQSLERFSNSRRKKLDLVLRDLLDMNPL